jgi:hypothetical protein
MSTEKQKAKWRKASVDYRKTHPDTVALYNRRTCHVRKAILKWMRNNRPDLMKKFEREAIKAFPLNQTPLENGR